MRRRAVARFIALFGAAACANPASQSKTRDTAIVAGAKIGVAPPSGVADGEWSMPARDYASSRFSNLAQITPANAKNLHV